MAKRQVYECDLSKQEFDPDEIVTITIKAKGKRQGRSYDLSPDSAARLEAQLMATNDKKLGDDWFFANTANPVRVAESSDAFEPEEIETPSSRRQELEEVTEQDDDAWVREKKAHLKKEGRKRTKASEELELEVVMNDDDSGCSHMNKGRVQMTIRDDERYAYHICRDCGNELPVMTQAESAAFLRGKPPEGVNVRDLSD